jgi:hypothetical protein
MSMGKGVQGLVGPTVLASISLLFALLLAEGMVRIAAPQQTLVLREDIFQPADTLGWTHRPDVATTINTGEKTVQVRTDHRGYRVGVGGAVEGDRTILLLGDSFMAAMQVEYEESLAGRMEEGLANALGQTVGVRNTGVGAWDPPHYLLKARQVLDRERVDLVVVSVYLGNDVVERGSDAFEPRVESARPSFRIPRTLELSAWFAGLVAPLDFQLRSVSQLYVLVRTRLLELRMRAGLSSAYFPEQYLAAEATSARWDTTTAILAEVGARAAAEATPTVFVLIPAHFQVVQEDLERHVRAFDLDASQIRIDQPNEILGARLRAAGYPVLDPLPALRAAHGAGNRPYGRVDTHFNATGHEVVWEFVRDALVAALRSTGPESRPTPLQ